MTEESISWPRLLGGLTRREDQSGEAMAWAMGQLLSGSATPAQVAALLVGLRTKGESVDELTGLASTMTEFATPITVEGPAVDVVGSGGDQANTVNVSTMAAVVAAAAGARVTKHGNRGASSACGAADVLEELGVVLELPPPLQAAVIGEVGIGFLFARQYHPAMRFVGPVRAELGIPTVFNFLGPLANPAQPAALAVGVSDPRMAELMAGVLAARGSQGLVVYGDDGLDELTTTTSSRVWVYSEGSVVRTELDPADLGLPRATRADLVGGGPEHNAGVVRDVLAGALGPVRDIVLLNAAAALVAHRGPDAGRLLEDMQVALADARRAVDSGAAAAKLASWVAATQRAAAAAGS